MYEENSFKDSRGNIVTCLKKIQNLPLRERTGERQTITSVAAKVEMTLQYYKRIIFFTEPLHYTHSSIQDMLYHFSIGINAAKIIINACLALFFFCCPT